MAGDATNNQRINGRFAPGNSGRPRGSTNKGGKKLMRVLVRNSERIGHKIVQLALAGDSTALKIAADKLLPTAQAPKPATFLKIDLPPINNVNDVPVAMACVSAALAEGKLELAAAEALVGILKGYADITHASDINDRLLALEQAFEQRRNLRPAA